ncbi:MAG: TatD family hydrolase [Firmicutes bacterium]|nr:TatD family hydrolase [Bacillota bacterium]
MRLFDAHAHYDDKRFETEYEGGYVKALRDAKDAGVGVVINAGADIPSSKKSLEIASLSHDDATLPRVFACVGIHPTEVLKYPNLDGAMREIEQMASDPRTVAIGEVGLDYHYPDTERELQAEFFRCQLELAKKLSLPVVVHSRDATEDTLEILGAYAGERILLHCFSGSAETAQEYVKLGFYFSFGGVLTFKNAKKARAALSVIPNDRLMLETDCPYMAPAPHRGEINSSRYLPFVAEAMGEALGVTADEAAAVTYDNGLTFYNLRSIIR